MLFLKCKKNTIKTSDVSTQSVEALRSQTDLKKPLIQCQDYIAVRKLTENINKITIVSVF